MEPRREMRRDRKMDFTHDRRFRAVLEGTEADPEEATGVPQMSLVGGDTNPSPAHRRQSWVGRRQIQAEMCRVQFADAQILRGAQTASSAGYASLADANADLLTFVRQQRSTERPRRSARCRRMNNRDRWRRSRQQ
jgi:hypothetical protein